jgi:hypothetical protein
MMFLLIGICVLLYGFIVFKLVNAKLLKYLLAIVISPLYGILLFFIGMSFGNVFFTFFALLPILIGLIIVFRRK